MGKASRKESKRYWRDQHFQMIVFLSKPRYMVAGSVHHEQKEGGYNDV